MFQPSPAHNPADLVPVDAARRMAENGVLVGIGILALTAGIVALWAFILWWKRKMSAPEVQATACDADKCSSCSFMADFRTVAELSQHRVFGVIRIALTSLIPRIPIAEAGRKLVFKDLLTVKFKAVETALSDWLRDHHDDLEDMTSDTLQSSMLCLIADIIEAYESQLRRMGMPFVVLDVFSQWHGPRVDYLRDECRMICESDWINSNVERVGMCFSMVEHVLRTTMIDAEATMSNLNGQLTGKEYRGVTIGECPPRKRSGNSGMWETMAAAQGKA